MAIEVNRRYLINCELKGRSLGVSAHRYGDVFDQPFRRPLRNGELHGHRLRGIIQMGRENAVRVRRNESAQDGVERYIVFNLDWWGRRTELNEALNQVIPLRRRHFHFCLCVEILIGRD